MGSTPLNIRKLYDNCKDQNLEPDPEGQLIKDPLNPVRDTDFNLHYRYRYLSQFHSLKAGNSSALGWKSKNTLN